MTTMVREASGNNEVAHQTMMAVDTGDPEVKKALGDAISLLSAIDRDDIGSFDIELFDIVSAEDRVYHYVRSGDITSLIHIDIPALSAPLEGVSLTAHLRNLLVALNTICLHAALDGGVSKRAAYVLGRKLARKIQGCATSEELQSLKNSLFIPLSYCLLVCELTLPGVADKDVIKAIGYINDRYNERITVREVAEHVGLSSEYFSAKFKREAGMTVSAYISLVRIRNAEALLRFTDLSIGEIAAQLSYSSQSHFQSAFKRETGMTPQQFRMSDEEVISFRREAVHG